VWLTGKARGWYLAPLAVLAGFAATPLAGFVHPADPGLVRFVRNLPPSVRIGGISEELAVIPALTGRAITAAPEQAIPWHMGYYRPFERNLRWSLVAVSTADPARLASAIAQSAATHLMVDRALLTGSRIPRRYSQIVPDSAAAAQQALSRARSIVQQRAQACAVYRGRTAWLLDAGCLARVPAPGRI
jgi:hypothetical protein